LLPPDTIPELIRRAAAEAGFDAAGVAAVRAFPELEYFAGWIASGQAGEMKYLARRDEQGRLQRASLANAIPWARSVVVCAINYNADAPKSTELRDRSRGWISRYAWTREDYHDSVLRRLRQLEAQMLQAAPGIQTRCYVDTGPLVERVYARYAGLGWVGKNACIINQRLGSWLFLGVIVTSLELQPSVPAADRCGSCTRCIDACPTQAITAPRQLDARRCISYLTIEKRGALPEDLRAPMGNHVFGCDICQDVCPWNRRAPATAAPDFQPRAEAVAPVLAWLANLAEEGFRQVFRGSPIKRAKRNGLRRNAAVAMGNSGDPRFAPVLQDMAHDEDPVVAEHARWALQQLKIKPRAKS
jgi:epoxyqueuosine reductase